MNRTLPVATLLLALLAGLGLLAMPPASIEIAEVPTVSAAETHTSPKVLKSGSQTKGSGVVIKILSDDLSGSRHQRFILRLDSRRTLLIVHNIDLAPRIESLEKGDIVAFFGEYETNPQGGLIHWTHRDPAGRHVAGWLKHNGRTYQ